MTQSILGHGEPREDGAAGAPVYDLAFVGAGASTSYVLLSLLDLLAERPRAEPLRLVVVERAPDPFPGVAYGSRAARTALLITPLRDFLPHGERQLFSEWLAENKQWAFEEFLAAGGPFSARWTARHREELERNDFEDLFLPRYLFGVYLAQRVRAAIDRATAAGAVSVEEIRDDVLAIDPTPEGQRIRGAERTLHAARTVLATGSAPIRPRLAAAPGTAAVLVDSPFEGMDEACRRIRDLGEALSSDEAPLHVVLVGGNAGTMDMLFQVNDIRAVGERGAVFTVLTPGGQLPERMERSGKVEFSADTLAALRGSEGVRAAAVFQAALADIARGRAAGLTVADTLAPISRGVMALLPLLSEEETLEFAGHWGVELGRHQRRAGWEYWEVVDELADQQRLGTVAGHFTGLAPTEGRGVRVVYEVEGRVAELQQAADVVINCGGPPRMLADADPSLVATLIARGVVRPTPHGGGIQVHPSLEAAPGLYVMGPLLAGNIVNGAPVWHMEHCGRISAFGSALGRQLADVLFPQEPVPVG